MVAHQASGQTHRAGVERSNRHQRTGAIARATVGQDSLVCDAKSSKYPGASDPPPHQEEILALRLSEGNQPIYYQQLNDSGSVPYRPTSSGTVDFHYPRLSPTVRLFDHWPLNQTLTPGHMAGRSRNRRRSS